MQHDLLDEKDFLGDAYLPWRRFYIYAGAAFICTQLIFWPMVQNKYPVPEYVLIIFVSTLFVVMPLSISIIMALSKKEMLTVKNRTIVSGIAFVNLSCFFSFLICLAISEGKHFTEDEYNFIIPVAIYSVIFLLSMAIIIPVINWRKKYPNGRAKQQLPQ